MPLICTNYAKALFYAPVLFLKKWAIIKGMFIKNDVPVRGGGEPISTNVNKPARGSVN
jgi:hypothetical protein